MKRLFASFMMAMFLLSSCGQNMAGGSPNASAPDNGLTDNALESKTEEQSAAGDGSLELVTPEGMLPYHDLPPDYSLEQAKADGCVVYEDIDITSGQEIWDEFVEKTSLGEPAFVRLAFYYTLGDPSNYSPELYEEMKDEYPVLYIQDLFYDGERYQLYSVQDGQEYIQEYKYLMRYLDIANPEAVYTECIRYVLINDDSHTWDELEWSRYSSQTSDNIDYTTVYWKYTYKPEHPNGRP